MYREVGEAIRCCGQNSMATSIEANSGVPKRLHACGRFGQWDEQAEFVCPHDDCHVSEFHTIVTRRRTSPVA